MRISRGNKKRGPKRILEWLDGKHSDKPIDRFKKKNWNEVIQEMNKSLLEDQQTENPPKLP